MGQFIDLTGKQFGKWKVLKRVEDYITPKGHPLPAWLCECQCELCTQRVVLGESLRKNRSKSCGLCKKPNKDHKPLKNNIYEEEKDFIRGFNQEKTKSFLIDKEDYDKIKNMYWSNSSTHGYWECISKKILLHKFLFDVPDGCVVDHKNRDRNDCRKSNLRVATRRENCLNRGLSNNNTSGIIGVRLPKGKKSWEARININKKIIVIGSFKEKEDAIKARLEAELKYFGKDFAPQRHLFKQYGVK